MAERTGSAAGMSDDKRTEILAHFVSDLMSSVSNHTGQMAAGKVSYPAMKANMVKDINDIHRRYSKTLAALDYEGRSEN